MFLNPRQRKPPPKIFSTINQSEAIPYWYKKLRNRKPKLKLS
jgi:hypothetical protein